MSRLNSDFKVEMLFSEMTLPLGEETAPGLVV